MLETPVHIVRGGLGTGETGEPELTADSTNNKRQSFGSAFFICSKTPFVGADACIGPRGVGDAAPYNVSKNYSIGKTGTAGRGLPALRITRRPFVTSIVYKPPKLRYNKTNKNFDESRSYHAHQSDRTLLQ